MTWGRNRSWGFPPIMDYASAARHEANVKPIRGDKNGTKPLGDRRKKWNNINRDPNSHDIFINYGSTEIVRYKPNGDVIVNNGGWPTATTHDFLYALLRLHVRTFDSKAWVSCYYQPGDIHDNQLGIIEKPVAVSGEWVMPNNTPLTFRMDTLSRQWVTSDIELPYTHRVNRQKANLVRKSYAKFRHYLIGITKLRTETREQTRWNGEVETERVVVVSKEELSSRGFPVSASSTHLVLRKHGEDTAKRVDQLMRSDDADANYEAFLQLVRGTYGYGYIPHAGIAVHPHALIEFYDKLLLFIHKDSVLVRTPAARAKAKRDPYGAWFM